MALPHPWHEQVVSEMLDSSAARWPDNVAIVDGTRRLTFSELRHYRDRLASALVSPDGAGIRTGTRVGLHLGGSWRHIALLYALFHIGAVAVPLNLAWQSRELARALSRAEIDVLVAGRSTGKADLSAVTRALGLPSAGPATVPGLPGLRAVITDDPADSSVWSLSRLLDSDAAGTVSPSRRQESLVLFTSGSAAEPKAVLIRQDVALGASYFFGQRLGLSPHDRWLNLSPYYHAGGIMSALLPAHMAGASHYVFPEFDARAMAQTAVAEGCTATGGFEMVLARLLDEFKMMQVASPLRKVAVAPGPLVHDELETQGARVLLMYALTEAGNLVTLTDPASGSERGRMSNGRPLPGVDIRICQPGLPAALPAGTAGEICFRGWNLLAGYCQPGGEVAAPVVDDDGFFHTGDYGWLDAAGRLYYRGRYSMMIKTGGENVSEAEVEGFLTEHLPSIRVAAVVGVRDDQWGEAVVAFVEVTEPSAFDGDELREQCKGAVAAFKIPRRFLRVAPGDWPLGPAGKIDKHELRRRARVVGGG